MCSHIMHRCKTELIFGIVVIQDLVVFDDIVFILQLVGTMEQYPILQWTFRAIASRLLCLLILSQEELTASEIEPVDTLFIVLLFLEHLLVHLHPAFIFSQMECTVSDPIIHLAEFELWMVSAFSNVELYHGVNNIKCTSAFYTKYNMESLPSPQAPLLRQSNLYFRSCYRDLAQNAVADLKKKSRPS